ncbi:EAL domain-containing protein [Radiobacillus kanasensis]|uniref:putative bifunctional diguanylate cyclase/phosphodiesterase n=1 Tax=Radiobacillus kanasensis TaxID=2844358 RepID=UPI001E619BC5|nr:EAL domain-containing protein [Radiobacillus kanasensis]UFT99320.1 EAL domain-containing protein [Radiobacillus kanasensis]
MNRFKKPTGPYLFVITFFISSFILMGLNQLSGKATLSLLLSILGGSVSMIWLFQAYQLISNKSRRVFWLLLSIGTLFYIASNLSSLLLIVHAQTTRLLDLSYYLRITAYLIFLSSLMFKAKTISIRLAYTNLFNIFVFMAFSTAMSFHYLIKPMMEMTGLSYLETGLMMIYPIISWSILFVILYLQKLVDYSEEKRYLQLVMIGLFLQVVVDFYVGSQLSKGIYQPTNPTIVLTSSIGILLTGLAGRITKANITEIKSEMSHFYRNLERLFPYTIAVCLVLLMFHSYHWHMSALSYGMIIVFMMILGRQIYIVKKNEEFLKEYRFLAYHDPLTGLYNRTSYKNDVQEILELKDELLSVGVLLMDIDRFKNVNDTLGHYVGDCILNQSAKRLRQALGDNRVYRFGGDEFIVIITQGTKKNCVEAAENILKAFEPSFFVNNIEISVTPSIGICLYPQDGTTGESLLKNADAAMYLAKASGKNNYKFFNNDLNKMITRKVELENDLRKAIEQNQLSLVYQPKVTLSNGKISGMEALCRWNHPIHGAISPAEFIPIAEETGQIIGIGNWVLKTACTQTKNWHDIGYRDLSVSVNVSVRQLEQPNFISTIKGILDETGINPACLELEITESIMKNIKYTKTILQQLRELGVTTSIDDFGTGYSSLHILKELPIDTIKIDKSFVQGIMDPRSVSMIKSIIDMGLNLNLQVVAEGIEEEYQVIMLNHYKCTYAQGYYFSKPLVTKQFEEYFASVQVH